jgi:hypothetical protein
VTKTTKRIRSSTKRRTRRTRRKLMFKWRIKLTFAF